MKKTLSAAALAAVTAIGLAGAADAATVKETDASWLTADAFTYEVETAGNYSLDFSGDSRLGSGRLGSAAYVLAEVDGGLSTLLDTISAGGTFSVYDGSSISLGFLNVGDDLAAAIWAYGGSLTMSLNLDDTQPAPVPLPASLPLLAGAIGMAGFAARRRKSN